MPESSLTLFAGAALLMVLAAARLAAWFAKSPLWLAVRLALDPRRN